MNKKAVSTGVLITLVLAVILIVFVLYNLARGGEEGKNIVDRNTCEQSVNQKEGSKILGEPFPGNLQCKTFNVTIKDTDEENIKENIANEMFYCWKQFGSGKKDFLDDYDFGKSDTWCFICSRIEFSDKVKNKYDYITGLENYINEKNIPGRDQTYASYFSGQNVQEGRIPIDGQILTSQDLYVLFLANKNADFLDNLQKGTILPTVFGGIAIVSLLYPPTAALMITATGAKVVAIGIGTLFVANEGFTLTTLATEYKPGLFITDSAEIVKQCSTLG